MMKQIVSPGISILGGVTLKTHQPAVLDAVADCLGLEITGDHLTVVYFEFFTTKTSYLHVVNCEDSCEGSV